MEYIMMPSVLRLREYIKAAKRAQQCAHDEQNQHAKQIFQEIERPYHRLVEMEKCMADQQQYNRPFAHFGMFNGRRDAGGSASAWNITYPQ